MSVRSLCNGGALTLTISGISVWATYIIAESAVIVYIFATENSECMDKLTFSLVIYLSVQILNLFFVIIRLYNIVKFQNPRYRPNHIFRKYRIAVILFHWIAIVSLCIILFMNRLCLEADVGITILVLMGIEVISIAIILVYVLSVFLKKSTEVRHTKADDRYKVIGKLKAKYEGEVIPCSICLADIAQLEEIIKLKCSAKHVFHENCIKSWMDVKICCPICRKNIN